MAEAEKRFLLRAFLPCIPARVDAGYNEALCASSETNHLASLTCHRMAC